MRINFFYIFSIHLLFVSCTNIALNEELNVISVIQEYNLNLHYIPGSTVDSSLHGDGQIFVSLYGNKETDSCLYILKNAQNDTLFVHLFKGIGNYYQADIIKRKSQYFLLFRDLGKTTYLNRYPNIIKNSNVPNSYKIDDITNVFKIDIINNRLISINRATDSEVIDCITKYFDLKGDFYMIHSPFGVMQNFNRNKINALITVAKDTIDQFQSYYQVDAQFKLQKMGENYGLVPVFNDINFVGLYKNNISYWELEIGKAKDMFIGYKYYYYYLNPDDNSYSRHKKFNRIELCSYEQGVENVISTLKAEDLKVEINGDSIIGSRFSLFQHNDDYFISTFLPYIDEYINGYPPIYLLDTLKLKLKPVKPFKPNKTNIYSPIKDFDFKKLYESGTHYSKADYSQFQFYDKYSISKVNNDYRLIKLKE